jgi:hypothetical protein
MFVHQHRGQFHQLQQITYLPAAVMSPPEINIVLYLAVKALCNMTRLSGDHGQVQCAYGHELSILVRRRRVEIRLHDRRHGRLQVHENEVGEQIWPIQPGV